MRSSEGFIFELIMSGLFFNFLSQTCQWKLFVNEISVNIDNMMIPAKLVKTKVDNGAPVYLLFDVPLYTEFDLSNIWNVGYIRRILIFVSW